MTSWENIKAVISNATMAKCAKCWHVEERARGAQIANLASARQAHQGISGNPIIRDDILGSTVSTSSMQLDSPSSWKGWNHSFCHECSALESGVITMDECIYDPSTASYNGIKTLRIPANPSICPSDLLLEIHCTTDPSVLEKYMDNRQDSVKMTK